jgi:hypothetical protein
VQDLERQLESERAQKRKLQESCDEYKARLQQVQRGGMAGGESAAEEGIPATATPPEAHPPASSRQRGRQLVANLKTLSQVLRAVSVRSRGDR